MVRGQPGLQRLCLKNKTRQEVLDFFFLKDVCVWGLCFDGRKILFLFLH